MVTVALDRTVRVLRVVDFSERRGASEAGRALYEDLAPPPERPDTGDSEIPRTAQPTAVRDPGAGRPTKRERRAIGGFTGDEEPF